jgi:hypothetical protein
LLIEWSMLRGLEADQKVIAAHGCYAMTATTSLTAQNTRGVYDIHQVPPSFLRKQIDACLDDIGADVVKTGMVNVCLNLSYHMLTMIMGYRHAGLCSNHRDSVKSFGRSQG